MKLRRGLGKGHPIGNVHAIRKGLAAVLAYAGCHRAATLAVDIDESHGCAAACKLFRR